MKNRILKLTLSLLVVFSVISCSNEDDGNGATASVKVYITDAPVDNANVKGAFVTITDVRVNGSSVENFNAVTIDLMQYQDGDTKLLGDLEVEAKSDTKVTLVLDYAADVEGNAPGCYILDGDNVKHALESGSNEITVENGVEVFAETANELVVDFDLRKTIRSSAESQFEFVSGSAMKSAIRVVNKAKTAKISGNVTGRSNANGDVIVVHAYKKGEYSDNEEDENGEGVRFSGAVTSDLVDSDTGAYTLSFLEEGEYELHFASYSRSTVTGEAEFRSSLTVESLVDLNILSLELTSSVNLSVNVMITGTVN